MIHRFPYIDLFPHVPNSIKDLNPYFSLSPTLTPPQNSPNHLPITSVTPKFSTTPSNTSNSLSSESLFLHL